jgi:integrase
LKELLKRYSLHVEERVRQGQLSPRTWIAQRYRLKSGCEFLKAHYPTGMDTKLTSIDGDRFDGYLKWRQEQVAARGRTIRRDVVRDELLVIRKMFLWAQKARLCTAKSVPNWDFFVERQGPKRPRITYENYRDFFNTVFSWVNESKDVKDAYQRRVLMYIAVAVSLSGMRSGEIFGLKNSDIERRGKTDCLVKIRAETSKVRRGRQIIVPRMLAKWLNEFQRHKEPSEFVFSPYADGRRSARDVFYHYYKSLRERLKDVGLDWFDLYHCRHWWITNRLLAEEPIHLVAQAAGTSVKEIESTYSHVLTELTTKRFAEKKVVWKPDGSYEVIKQLEQDRSPS